MGAPAACICTCVSPAAPMLQPLQVQLSPVPSSETMILPNITHSTHLLQPIQVQLSLGRHGREVDARVLRLELLQQLLQQRLRIEGGRENATTFQSGSSICTTPGTPPAAAPAGAAHTGGGRGDATVKRACFRAFSWAVRLPMEPIWQAILHCMPLPHNTPAVPHLRVQLHKLVAQQLVHALHGAGVRPERVVHARKVDACGG